MPAVLTLATRERRLPAPADPDVRVALAARLARLAGVEAAHLARLRQVRERADGFVLVHDEPESGSPWQARSPRSEVLAMGLALEQALAGLHAAGLAHGSVSAEQVLRGPDGSVTLVGTGSSWGAEPARATEDVAALARLLLDSFEGGSIGASLAVVLVRAADPDPAVRPRLAVLGEALEREAASVLPAEPVSPAPVPTGDPPGGPAAPGLGELRARLRTQTPRLPRPARRQGARRRGSLARRLRGIGWREVALLLAWGVGVALLVQGGLGLWRGRPPATAPTGAAVSSPPAGPTGSVTDWRAVVTALDAERRRVLATGSVPALVAVLDPEGPAYTRDLATIRARADAGVVLFGAEVAVTGVAVAEQGRGRVELEVTDTRGPWELRDSDGTVVASGGSRGAVTWRVVLTGSGSHWRVLDARPA